MVLWALPVYDWLLHNSTLGTIIPWEYYRNMKFEVLQFIRKKFARQKQIIFFFNRVSDMSISRRGEFLACTRLAHVTRCCVTKYLQILPTRKHIVDTWPDTIVDTIDTWRIVHTASVNLFLNFCWTNCIENNMEYIVPF